jgi:hypothetical protein
MNNRKPTTPEQIQVQEQINLYDQAALNAEAERFAAPTLEAKEVAEAKLHYYAAKAREARAQYQELLYT